MNSIITRKKVSSEILGFFTYPSFLEILLTSLDKPLYCLLCIFDRVVVRRLGLPLLKTSAPYGILPRKAGQN